LLARTKSTSCHELLGFCSKIVDKRKEYIK
jgi:hypothetical protein